MRNENEPGPAAIFTQNSSAALNQQNAARFGGCSISVRLSGKPSLRLAARIRAPAKSVLALPHPNRYEPAQCDMAERNARLIILIIPQAYKKESNKLRFSFHKSFYNLHS